MPLAEFIPISSRARATPPKKWVRTHGLPIVWIITRLTAAACLILLVIILPARISSSARFDSQIATGFEAIDVCAPSELRGG